MNFKFVLYPAILIPVMILGQSQVDQKLTKNRTLLASIKKEIHQLQRQINQSKEKERSILDQINLLDKQMALTARAKGILKEQSRLLEKKMQQTNRKLRDSEARYSQLKQLYAQRAVYAFKYGKIRNIELLLTSRSINQALIRYKYLRLIANQDAKTIQAIKKEKKEIEQIQTQLSATLDLKKKNLTDKTRQEKHYAARRSKKARFLKKIRSDRTTYLRQLSVKQKQQKNLLALIISLEKERKGSLAHTASPEVIPNFNFKDFYRARGRLPWPVKGKVITRYGKQKDPKSKTYVKNTDIEISSKLGTPVRCVFTGVVRIITYLPGYGNTVIVDHGKGYYTVYSHLAEIYVTKDEGLKTGQIIATVGDSGSLAGAKLQFGIYGGQKTYNPEKWLAKAGR